MANIFTATAFTDRDRGGNRAGVVLPGHGFDRAGMQRLAAELGHSETVFLSPSARTDFRLEYFTPTEEVPLCGHATIAAFVVLGALGQLDRPDYTIETGAGTFRVGYEEGGRVFMEQGLPEFGPILPPGMLESSLPGGSFSPRHPIQIVSTGLRDILAPMESPRALTALIPDFPAMTELSREQGVVGVHAFALSEEPGITALCRNFAPLYGIDEESATGTSNCALACYLFRRGIRPTEYVFRQGEGMGNPSVIRVRLTAEGEHITGVMVGGEGCVLSKVF